MRKLKVLLADDAVVVRRLLTQLLESDPALCVAAAAANGRLALEKLPLVKPDVVILDVEMPEMNGLETLAAIRRNHPRLPVIMFSSLTERGAAVTLDALALGANDYVAKPADVGSITEALGRVREDLIPKIKALCGGATTAFATEPRTIPRAAPGSIPLPVQAPKPGSVAQRIDIVAIGVSTGGPNALAALLPRLPGDFPVPIVIVQHMPPIFTRQLAARLDSMTALPVREGTDGAVLSPGQVWVAPGDHHLAVEREGTSVKLKLHQGPLENSCRPAVDVLFRAVARVYQAHALGLIMTGMGYDGLRGCEAIRAGGGQVFAQDEASSVVWGMPGSVARAGIAQRVLPLSALAGEIIGRVGWGRPLQPAPRTPTRPLLQRPAP